VITQGKFAHRTPSGVRERHHVLALFESKNFIDWNSVGLNMCELNTKNVAESLTEDEGEGGGTVVLYDSFKIEVSMKQGACRIERLCFLKLSYTL
jgi:hypothetical protein